MASVADVKEALRQNDRKTAGRLLKQVLSEKPTAEAWYLAARMTSDKDQKIKHLKRALFIDPKHGDSLSYMSELGVNPASGGGGGGNMLANLGGEIVSELDAFSERTPVLRDMERQTAIMVSGAVLGLVFLVVVGLLVTTVANFNAPPAPLPTPEPIVLLSANPDSVTMALQSSTLPIIDITVGSVPDGYEARQALDIVLSDDGVTNHTATLYFYDSGLTMAQDLFDHFTNQDGYTIHNRTNLILAVPNAISEATHASLADFVYALV